MEQQQQDTETKGVLLAQHLYTLCPSFPGLVYYARNACADTGLTQNPEDVLKVIIANFQVLCGIDLAELAKLHDLFEGTDKHLYEINMDLPEVSGASEAKDNTALLIRANPHSKAEGGSGSRILAMQKQTVEEITELNELTRKLRKAREEYEQELAMAEASKTIAPLIQAPVAAAAASAGAAPIVIVSNSSQSQETEPEAPPVKPKTSRRRLKKHSEKVALPMPDEEEEQKNKNKNKSSDSGFEALFEAMNSEEAEEKVALLEVQEESEIGTQASTE